MTSVGIRDLKNHLSRYLRKLRPGQVIAITDRGRVVAELRAPASVPELPDAYSSLIAKGTIRPARESGDPLAGLGRAAPAPKGTAARLIREDRDE
jgi:antitoxin (DNA-binding transcriptional repressor) of toxin-antitoxin stability system